MKAVHEIYISFAQEDVAFAEIMMKGLAQHGISCWPNIESAYVKEWPHLNEWEILNARAVLVIVSRNVENAHWIQREVQIAQGVNKRIIPVTAEDVRLPDFLAHLEAIPLYSNLEAGLEQLIAEVIDQAHSHDRAPDRADSRYFDEEQSRQSPATANSAEPSTDAAQAVMQERGFEAAEPAPSEAATSELPEALRSQIVARAWAFENPEGLHHDSSEVTSTAPEPRELEERVLPQPSEEISEDVSQDKMASEAELEQKTTQGRLVRYVLIAGAIAIAVWLGTKFFPLLLGVTSSAKSRKSNESSSETQPVDCSVFAPPNIAPGGEMLVQVFLHPPGKAEEAEAGARQFDIDAQWRGFASLSLELSSGDRVGVELNVGNLDVSDDGLGEVRWSNAIVGLSFIVRAPEDARPGKHHATARFLVDGVPVGRIHFVIEVQSSKETEMPARGTGDLLHRYKKAFISYASKDRAEVLKRVQTLGALNIDYFQDVLDLEPGDRWRQALYTEIERCDLFLLFWSSESRKSRWVRKEAQYAISCQTRTGTGEPEIIPIIIEGPPTPKPWPECAHLHFNDKLIYLMRVEEDQFDSQSQSH